MKCLGKEEEKIKYRKIKYAVCDCCGDKICINDEFYEVTHYIHDSFECGRTVEADICKNCINKFALQKIEEMDREDELDIDKNVLYGLDVEIKKYDTIFCGYKIEED